ncbi:hypothetical protein BFP97_11745 [Roseivirga sp. 4D4]|uniref:PepSY domain-containing protein n=1 Tax=Roseivirga sp. 4D4 TaxID=1889784 RepID=UPI000853120B|nr:PepSY domain-containing protein [Roseivirga sp. 4D4]OEK02154.1 hypothetical protein BFP97_11745 [Roseivirga sp. 4D4]
MSLSLWRVTHLWLAIISTIFLLIASITGAILSFEPIYQKTHSYQVKKADDLLLSKAITNITAQHEEVLNISRDKNGFVSIQTIDSDTPFYVDPFTGLKIGDLIRTPRIFEFSRTLHRSLFLGQIGRFLIGLASVILMFMALSGFFLILKKQGGLKNYFSKVIKNDFYKDYHTRLSRWLILSIIVLGATGTYLFMERFNLVVIPPLDHSIDEARLTEEPKQALSSFEAFNTYTLEDLRDINFPFAEFPEEYYEVKLKNKELLVNQFNGEVISKLDYPFVKLAYQMSFNLHTGEGTIIWAAILGLTCIGILFFIYSGFAIYLKRDKTKIVNPYGKTESQIVILVGSEQGSTMSFAIALQKSLLKLKHKVYLTGMDNYEPFNSMEHLLILTSTYGVGEAPANATKFIDKVQQLKQSQPFQYSVLGFGSTAYPDFCQFAIESDDQLSQVSEATELVPLHKVNNGSKDEFLNWINALGAKLGHEIVIDEKDLSVPKKKQSTFKVLDRRDSPNAADQTFLLELKASKRKLKAYQSGDLLSIVPPEESRERLYSMSVDREASTITLSIRKHEMGLCSNHLSQVNPGSKVLGNLRANPDFHFPKEAPGIIMIANGTGIAPYLGMINDSSLNQHISLFWGGQNKASYQLYEDQLEKAKASGKLNKVITAFSREGDEKQYVQDVIAKELESITTALSQGHVIMICGGLSMQQAVEKVLAEHLKKGSGLTLDHLKMCGQIKTDCY